MGRGPSKKEPKTYLGKELRRIIGQESYTAFAARCGLKEHHIRRIMEGAVPSFDTLSAIHRAIGLDLNALVEGSPIYDKEYGFPLQITGRTGWIDSGAHLDFKEGDKRGYIEISGSDMEDEFAPGDIVIIEEGELKHDDYAVCLTEDAVLLRKVAMDQGRAIFYALNARSEPPFTMESGQVKKAYKVTMKIKKL